MVTYLTSPLLLETHNQTRWLANSNQGHSHFPYDSWSSCIYLIQYQNMKILSKSITLSYGTDIILQSIPQIKYEYEKYFVEYRRTQITLLWIWIMSWRKEVVKMSAITSSGYTPVHLFITRDEQCPTMHLVVLNAIFNHGW